MDFHDYSLIPDVELPQRSQLYRLPPVKFEGPQRESLGSYFKRLADAHRITPHLLARHVVIPALETPPFDTNCADDFWRKPFFHTPTSVAQEWSDALNRLTGQTHLDWLTFLPMKAMVPAPRLASKCRKWCPCCFADDAKTNIHYGRLLWEFDIIEACPVHGIELVSKCICDGMRGERIHRSKVKHLPHICDKCGRDLGASASVMLATDAQLSVAQLVSTLLADPISTQGLPNSNFASFIKYACEKYSNGIPAHFAKLLGKSKSVVHEWLYNGRVTSFSTQVDIALALGCEIADLTTGDTSKLCEKPIITNAGEVGPTRPKLNHAQLEVQLKNVLLKKSPISAEAAAELLGIDNRTLYKNFGPLAKRISARYKEEREASNMRTVAGRQAVIAAAFAKVVNEGLTPSRKRVATEIQEHGGFPNAKDREFYEELRAHHTRNLMM